MSFKRDYYQDKDSEDSNHSLKEPNSLKYQIPMSYVKYQEMKDNSTRISSRKGTNHTNTISSHSAGTLKLLMETEDSTHIKAKNKDFENVTTPIFNENPRWDISSRGNPGVSNRDSSYSKLNNSRDQEPHYRKLIDLTTQYGILN